MIPSPPTKTFTIHLHLRTFIKEEGDNLINEGNPLKFTFDMQAATEMEALLYLSNFLKERIPSK